MNNFKKKYKRKRLIEIDILTGIAIVLVVLGHLANPDSRSHMVGNNIYTNIKETIYLFHMPLFMFLSGSIFYYTFTYIRSTQQYLSYLRKKALRLLPGLFLFGSLMIFAKMFLLYMNNSNYDFLQHIFINYFKLLFEPMNSFSRSLWYIYVLMEYYIVFPLLLIIFKTNKYWLLLIGLILYIFFTKGEFFAFKEFTKYFIFFSYGILFMSNYRFYAQHIKKYFIFYSILFVMSFLFQSFLEHKISTLIIGTLSIPAFYSLVVRYFYSQDNIFAKIGKYTFSIYLMNTLVIGIIEIILLKYIRLNGENFTYIFPFIFILAVLIPILLKKYFFNKIPILDKITK